MSAPLWAAMIWTAPASDDAQGRRLYPALALNTQEQKGRDDAALLYVQPNRSFQEAGNNS